MFGSNSKTPKRRGVFVGVIDDASWFKPQAYVYTSKKLPHTPVDPEVETFDEMRSEGTLYDLVSVEHTSTTTTQQYYRQKPTKVVPLSAH